MPHRYVYRFIHHRQRRVWSVRDTITDVVFGRYESEPEAVAAALEVNARHSAFRKPEFRVEVIPLQ